MDFLQETALSAGAGLRREMITTGLGPCAVRIHQAREEHGHLADVYLHGAAGSWTTFQPLLPGSPDCDQVLLDLPGWGDSTEGARIGTATVEAMAGAVVEVLDELGYGRWNLMGHSMGGVIALHLAAAWPERTLTVAAISPTAFGVAESVRQPWRGFASLPWFVGMLLLMRAMAALGTWGLALIRGVGSTPLMRLLLSPLFSDTGSVPAEVIRGLGRDARPMAFCAAARAIARYDFAQWDRIRCPVLAIRGADDTFTPQSDLDQLASVVSRVRTLTLPRCGHFAIAEQPAAVQALVDELRLR